MPRRIGIVAGACLAASFALAYGQVLATLAQDWRTDGNYSHGFLIPPLAAFFVWERRRQLAAIAPRPANTGLAIVAISLALLAAGVLGAERFLARVSLIGVLAGAVVFVAGWRHLRVLLFPLGFLILMIPIPAIVFNEIALPLQLLASRLGTSMLSMAGVPVFREGNVIVLATTSLEVAEACSGIRSLVSLLTLGTILGYFGSSSTLLRVMVAASAVPIAILTNALRIAGTGVAASRYGPQVAEGFFHTFSGWLVFVVSLALLWMLERTANTLAPVGAP